MKKKICAILGGMLILLATISYAEAPNTGGTILKADAGGPYYGTAGSDILFDASASSGDIIEYSWDYGDGTTGSGKTVKHAYEKEGSYLLTLHISDGSAKTGTYATGVFVRLMSIYLDAEIDPPKERYAYQDVLSEIKVTAAYSDGRPLEGALLSGVLSGKDTVPLSFREEGKGVYRSKIGYTIRKDDSRMEQDFINISVEAKDAAGILGMTVKKLAVLPGNTGASLTLQPDRGRFAYGQNICMQARFFRLKGNKNMEAERSKVVLYENGGVGAYALKREGDFYVYNYTISAGARGSLDYYVYGKGTLDGTEYNEASPVHYEVSPELWIGVISPLNDTYTESVKEIAVRIEYPDGSALPDSSLRGYIGGEEIVLERFGDLYRANYSVPAGKTGLHLWVFDSLGNGAGADIRLANIPPAEKNAGDLSASDITFALLPYAAVLAALFIAYKVFSARQSKKKKLEKEYEECRQNIFSLKAVNKNIMNEFYTRKLSEEDARKRVTETEKEIAAEKQRLKSLEEKLGKKSAEAQEVKEEAEKKK